MSTDLSKPDSVPHERGLRVANYELHFAGLEQLLRTGARLEVVDGLPMDARVVGAAVDICRGYVILQVESASFRVTLPGSAIERKTITVKDI